MRKRLTKTQLITTMYDVKSPVADTERMMLNAVVEPMMIRAIKHVKPRVTYIALAGTPEPGRTRERKWWKGSPLSAANSNISVP